MLRCALKVAPLIVTFHSVIVSVPVGVFGGHKFEELLRWKIGVFDVLPKHTTSQLVKISLWDMQILKLGFKHRYGVRCLLTNPIS